MTKVILFMTKVIQFMTKVIQIGSMKYMLKVI